MKNMMPTLVAAMLASFAVVSVVPQASAATRTGSVYAAKKAECTRKADQKKWAFTASTAAIGLKIASRASKPEHQSLD